MGGEDSGSALANRVNARYYYNNFDYIFARRIAGKECVTVKHPVCLC